MVFIPQYIEKIFCFKEMYHLKQLEHGRRIYNEFLHRKISTRSLARIYPRLEAKQWPALPADLKHLVDEVLKG